MAGREVTSRLEKDGFVEIGGLCPIISDLLSLGRFESLQVRDEFHGVDPLKRKRPGPTGTGRFGC